MNSRQRSHLVHALRKILKSEQTKPENSTTETQEPVRPESNPSSPEINRTQSEQDDKQWREKRKFLLELAGAAVLTVYTFFTILIWYQTRRAVDVNMQALVSVQRAFVNLRGAPQVAIDTDPISHKVSQWRFSMAWENSGATPTRNARYYFNVAGYPQPISDTFDFPDFKNSGSKIASFFLGPKGALATVPLPLNGEIIRLTKEHQLHSFIWGWTTYNDRFSDTPLHITMFCVELSEIQGEPAQPTQILWTNCRRHNCADDECKGEQYDNPAKRW